MSTRTFEPGTRNNTFKLNPLEVVSLLRQNTHRKSRLVLAGLVVADFMMLVVTFWAAYNVRFLLPTSNLFDQNAFVNEIFYTQMVYLLIPLWLLLFRIFHLYDPTILFSGHQEYTNIFNACTVGIMSVIVITFLDPTLLIARAWLLLTWLFAIFFVGLERFLVRRAIYILRRNGHFMMPTYIAGANPEGVAIAEQLMSNPMSGINIIGFLDNKMKIGEEVLPGVAVHGSTERAQTLVRKFGVERIIVATSGIEREAQLSMFKEFVNSDDVAIWLSSGMYEMMTTGVRVQDIGSLTMVSINRVRLTGINVLMKAILDYVGASLGLLMLSPLFLAIIIIMRFTDPGPIIYRRRVVGVGGKVFDAFKFRTMVVNSEQVLRELLDRDPEAREEYELHYKLKNDPRITKIGQFLRKTSVDELPQLLNVLRGEMSLVGPRMITVEEVERYGQWGLNLHTVKPGITGLWQVSGRSDITYEERVRLDMHYIRNYSIWIDLQILFQTVPSVLMSKGAY
jgi:exopolysaccharide biosynthesis polyprenyl glycosylphosphotransferase